MHRLSESEKIVLRRMNDGEELSPETLKLGDAVADAFSRVSGGHLSKDVLALILVVSRSVAVQRGAALSVKRKGK